MQITLRIQLFLLVSLFSFICTGMDRGGLLESIKAVHYYAMFDAAKKGDFSAFLSEAQKSGQSISAGDTIGLTVLHWAIFHNRTHFITQYCEAGGDLHVQAHSYFMFTPLHMAVAAKKVVAVHMLCSRQVNDILLSAQNETAMQLAWRLMLTYPLEEEFGSIFRILCNTFRDQARHFLFSLIEQDDVKLAEQAVSYISPDVADEHGMTLLHVLASRRHSALLKKCIELSAASVNACEKQFGYTPLHIAIAEGNCEAAEILAASSDLTIKDFKGRTPIDLAKELQRHGCLESIRKVRSSASDRAFLLAAGVLNLALASL